MSIWINDQLMTKGFDISLPRAVCSGPLTWSLTTSNTKNGLIEIRFSGETILGHQQRRLVAALEAGPGDGGPGATRQTIYLLMRFWPLVSKPSRPRDLRHLSDLECSSRPLGIMPGEHGARGCFLSSEAPAVVMPSAVEHAATSARNIHRDGGGRLRRRLCRRRGVGYVPSQPHLDFPSVLPPAAVLTMPEFLERR